MAYKIDLRNGVSEWVKIIRDHHPNLKEAELRAKYSQYPHAIAAIDKMKRQGWFNA